MARHGENIRKRKDGRWEGRYLVYDKEKGKKRYRSVYASTYEEVREKMAEEKNKGTNRQEGIRYKAALGDIRLSDMAQEWLEDIKDKKKPSTYVKYNLVYHNHIEKIFRDTMLADLTDGFVEEELPDYLSESIYKSIYCVMNQILKFTARRYFVTVPILKKPSCEGKNKPVKVLAKSEQKKLILVLYKATDRFKMAVLMCLFTGLRLGELCALKWEDIDFENKILTVSRTVQRLYAEGYETKTVLVESVPKSECSHREIPLSDAALEWFIKFQNGKEYVFGGSKPLEPKTMQYHFKKILKEAELPNKNFHILRHTFSTNCIEGGTDVKSLSEMLGHSNVQITLNRYVHPSMDTKRRYIDKLLGFYGQIHGYAG